MLNAVRSGEKDSEPSAEKQEKKYQKYDFSSPRKFTKDRDFREHVGQDLSRQAHAHPARHVGELELQVHNHHRLVQAESTWS